MFEFRGSIRICRHAVCGLALTMCGFAAARGAAQDGIASDTTATAANYTVRGVVENSLTHQPIARALVESRGNGVLTDGEGRFELSLAAGFTQIRARRPGFGDGRGTWRMLEVGPDMPELTLTLTPSATIAGHVTLPNGEPAEGIHVYAYRRRAAEGHMRWMMEGGTETNSVGTFRFLQLQAPGAYLVCTVPAREHQGVDIGLIPVFGYASTCLPGNVDFASAAPMNLVAGQQAELDVALARQRFYPVTMAVTNRQQDAHVQFEVRDRSGQSAGISTRWNPQRGAVESELPNGSYTADVRSIGGDTVLRGHLDFRVADGPAQGLTVAVGPQHEVQVEIRKDFTVAQVGQSEGVAYALENAGPGVYLTLIPADGTLEGGGGGGLRHPDGSNDNGLYEMDVSRPGRYWVQASAAEGYVSSITSGGVDLAREPLNVGAGHTAAPIEITLRNDAGQIECTVDTPTGAEGQDAVGMMTRIFAYAIPLFSSPARTPQASIQGVGPIMFPNLAPGRYLVAAFDANQEIDRDDAQAIARLSAMGQTVTVQAGSTAKIKLDMVRSNAEAASQ